MVSQRTQATRRSYLKGAVAGGTLVGLAGCVGDGTDGDVDVEMELASSYEPGHVLAEAAEDFKERIEEESDGQFVVETVPGAAYGGEEDHADLVFEGSIEGAAVGTPVWERYIDEYFIFNVQYTLRDFEHLQSIMESDVMEEGREELRQEANHRMIGGDHPWIYRGQRHFTSNEPVEEPGDVEGMALRLPEIEAWVEVWEEIGARPTPVALDELYSALQTGTVDASEGPPPQVETNNLYEVQDYYNLTSHHITPGAIYVSNDWFEGLDETYQDLIMDIGPVVHEEATETSRAEEEEVIDEIEDAGMEIIEDVDVDSFMELGEPAAEDLFEDQWVVTHDELQSM